MLRRLNRAYEEQLELLSRQQFVAIGDGLIGILERYYGGVEGFEEFRMALEQMRFELELANLRLQFEILRAQGVLSDAVLANIQGVFDFIDANPIDWAKFVAPEIPALDRVASSARDANSALEEMARRLTAAKERITDFILSLQRGDFGGRSNLQMFNAAFDQFKTLREQAMGGNIQAIEQFPEVARNFLDIARQRFGSTAEFQRILGLVEGTGIDLLGIDKIKEDNVVFDQRFLDAQMRHVQVDADGHKNVADAIKDADRQRSQDEERSREDILKALRDLERAQRALNERLAAIESRKRTDKAA
jgi:hypothetical protein